MKVPDTEKNSNIPVEPTYNVDKVNEHLERIASRIDTSTYL